MITWTLILSISLGTAMGVVESNGYPTIEVCRDTGETIKKDMLEQNRYMLVYYSCIPKQDTNPR